MMNLTDAGRFNDLMVEAARHRTEAARLQSEAESLMVRAQKAKLMARGCLEDLCALAFGGTHSDYSFEKKESLIVDHLMERLG
jgi:hypothetical protein